MTLKFRLLKWGGILLVLGALGIVVAASGIIPIKASSGHWPITRWFLSFSMRRSIVTHSFTIKAPPLEDPALVLKGAGHYETGCRPCHGSPGFEKPPVFQAMTPPPPYLPHEIPNWESDQLFYIVKHGIKFAGMPAWPTQKRDDEVWAMVAFLRKFPNLSENEYRNLVYGKSDQPVQVMPVPPQREAESAREAALESCARCHGVEGQGRGTGAFPKLAGQSTVYLLNALDAYARGERHSGVMQPVAARLRPETMRKLAEWYGDQASRVNAAPKLESDAAAIERGKTIAQQGIPKQRVPSCVDCHGPGAKRGKPAYPRLAGQYADYLYLQLTLFKSGHRGGSKYSHLMMPVASRLTEEQMRDVASYYASLPWPGPVPQTGE